MKTHTYQVKFDQLEANVRYGKQPDCPNVLNHYIDTSELIAQNLLDNNIALGFHYRIANILLETICDTCIERHWRVQCLDSIYRPMLCIQRRAHTPLDKQQLHRFRSELNTLCNYFL